MFAGDESAAKKHHVYSKGGNKCIKVESILNGGNDAVVDVTLSGC